MSTIKEKCYECDFGEDDHQRLAEVLREIKGKFILSYDDTPSIRELYKDFNIQITKPVRYSTNNTENASLVYKNELLITNFSPKQTSLNLFSDNQKSLDFDLGD